MQAARTIGRIVQSQVEKGITPPPEAVEALTKALHSDRSELKEAAEEALKRVGKGASAAIPALIKDLVDATPKTEASPGLSAAEILGDVAPGTERAGEAISALITALDAKDVGLRRAVARALLKFGPAASTALPRLQELANDPDPSVVLAAKAASDRIEGKTQPESARRKGQGRRGKSAASLRTRSR
jgi:HEAT repeat protein